MAINNSKLTSVKVIDDLYKKFRKVTINSDMNLQRLTNRCIHLYLNDFYKGLRWFRVRPATT